MLVLTRKKHERIRIGDVVICEIVDVRGDKVRLGFDAPPDVEIHREEVFRAIQHRRMRQGGNCGNSNETAQAAGQAEDDRGD